SSSYRDWSSDVCSSDLQPKMTQHLARFSSSRIFPLPPQQWDRLLEVLQKYRWPGNIRELENLAKCCVILGWEEAMGHIERDGDRSEERRVGKEGRRGGE